jgi:hypothetical protein
MMDIAAFCKISAVRPKRHQQQEEEEQQQNEQCVASGILWPPTHLAGAFGCTRFPQVGVSIIATDIS